VIGGYRSQLRARHSRCLCGAHTPVKEISRNSVLSTTELRKGGR